MQEQLKKEIRRCQFLQMVYSDFGDEYQEANQLLANDIGAALVALEGDFEEQTKAFKKLEEWI